MRKKYIFLGIFFTLLFVILSFYYNLESEKIKHTIYQQSAKQLHVLFKDQVDKKQGRTAAMTYIISQATSKNGSRGNVHIAERQMLCRQLFAGYSRATIETHRGLVCNTGPQFPSTIAKKDRCGSCPLQEPVRRSSISGPNQATTTSLK